MTQNTMASRSCLPGTTHSARGILCLQLCKGWIFFPTFFSVALFLIPKSHTEPLHWCCNCTVRGSCILTGLLLAEENYPILLFRGTGWEMKQCWGKAALSPCPAHIQAMQGSPCPRRRPCTGTAFRLVCCTSPCSETMVAELRCSAGL